MWHVLYNNIDCPDHLTAYLFYILAIYKKQEIYEFGEYLLLNERIGWDSNPRVLSYNLISSQPRYDRFDTFPGRRDQPPQ